MENGAPEGNRTPDPRFRKRDFGAFVRCDAVRGGSPPYASLHETDVKVTRERELRGVNGRALAWSHEAVTGV